MSESPLRLATDEVAVLIVDVQERLVRAMPEPRVADVQRCARILLGAARELQLPVLYSEQYPKGLGPTQPELLRELESSGAERFEKLDFSACSDELARSLKSRGRSRVVVMGMEAHVCVYLTTRQLQASGFLVHVPIDGVASRRDDHRQTGLDLCQRAGAVLTTAETVVFDWMTRAGTEQFKKISALVR
jgi:nicotinamidase-related amidase